MPPFPNADEPIVDADPVALKSRGAAEADAGLVDDGPAVHLDLEPLVPVAAKDDSVVAGGVHLVVVVLAAQLLPEDQGDVVLRRGLEGDATTAGLREAELLVPGALEGGHC